MAPFAELLEDMPTFHHRLAGPADVPSMLELLGSSACDSYGPSSAVGVAPILARLLAGGGSGARHAARGRREGRGSQRANATRGRRHWFRRIGAGARLARAPAVASGGPRVRARI